MNKLWEKYIYEYMHSEDIIILNWQRNALNLRILKQILYINISNLYFCFIKIHILFILNRFIYTIINQYILINYRNKDIKLFLKQYSEYCIYGITQTFISKASQWFAIYIKYSNKVHTKSRVENILYRHNITYAKHNKYNFKIDLNAP